MKNMKKLAAGMALASTALWGTAAMAAPLTIDNDLVTTTPYVVQSIPYEAYAGGNINVDGVPFFLRLSAPVTTGTSVNITATGAQINAGGGFVFLLARTADIKFADPTAIIPGTATPIVGLQLCQDANGGPLSPIAATDAGGNDIWAIVGESTSSGTVLNSVTILTSTLDTFCKRNPIILGNAPSPTIIYPAAANTFNPALGLTSTTTITVGANNLYVGTALGSITSEQIANITSKKQSPQIAVGPPPVSTANPIIAGSINLNIPGGLAPNCTTFPKVQLSATVGLESTVLTTVLQIRPQITGSISAQALAAGLDTDFDFTRFIGPADLITASAGGASVVWDTLTTYIGSTLTVGTTPATIAQIVDLNLEGGALNPPVIFLQPLLPTTPIGIGFALESTTAQPGVSVNFAGQSSNCTRNSTTLPTVWTCSDSNLTLGQVTNGTQEPVVLANNTAFEMSPTNWNFGTAATSADFVLTVNPASNPVKACLNYSGLPLGSWFGGLEAIVPFFKYDPANNYQTFVKLTNRYKKAAKLYVSNMRSNQQAIVISTKQLTGKEIIPTGGFVTVDGASLLADNVIATQDGLDGVPIKFLIRVPAQAGSNGFSLTSPNNLDPYVTGIVVSTFVTAQGDSAQRSIPLLFKTFKNGQYSN